MSSDSDGTYMYKPDTIRVKKTFSKEDDEELLLSVQSAPSIDWNEISMKLGKWTARQCRERWKNYVDPSLLKTEWTAAEDNILLEKHYQLGTNWAKIKTFLPGRATNAIKNRLGFLKQNTADHSSPAATDESDENQKYVELLRISNLINNH